MNYCISFKISKENIIITKYFIVKPSRTLYKVVPVFLLTLFLAFSVHGQSLSDIDFRNLRADELSDQQIEQIWEAAQARNMSISELSQMAEARGTPPGEISKLRTRLMDIRSGGGQGVSGTQDAAERQRSTTSSTPPEAASTNQDDPDTRIFGYDLFREGSKSFEPSLNIPTPENYELGAGDQLIIDIWGASENTYQLSISPEGTIRIPGVGPIYLNGLSIEQAREKLRRQLTEIYSGLQSGTPSAQRVYMQVSLGSVRSIKVSLIGQVQSPGTYTLPSLATVFNALYTAGGPTRGGSFRSIEVIRSNEVVAELDIYDFLVHSDQEDNIRLHDQDIIKIPPYKQRVTLNGAVKQPGIFEMLPGETLSDLFMFAGGFTANAYQKSVTVQRKTDTQLRVDDVSKKEFDTYEMKIGDSVRVSEILDRYENRITIEGAVFRPGTYELTDTSTVHSLIQRAEGVREYAFMNRGLIFRKKEDMTTKMISFSVSEVLNNPEQNDIPLQREDQVRISSIFDMREELTVSVNGSVLSPGTINYVDEMTLEDVILRADGFSMEAEPDRIEVARRIEGGDPDTYDPKIAELFSFQVNEDLTLSERATGFTIQPFDQIFVRKSPEYETQRNIVIRGQVLYPGQYTLETEDTRISDIIERAGGLTPEAFPEGATLMRIKAGEDDVARNLSTVVEETGENVDQTTLEREKGNRQQVALNLPKILEEPGSKYDFLMEEGDRLNIPKELQTVRVTGEVLFPVSIRYQKGQSFKQYINSAGGYTDSARVNKAFVVYANGEVDRVKKFLFFKNRPNLKPGARIVVPRKERKRELSTSERVGIISAIVSTLAIIANVVDNLGN